MPSYTQANQPIEVTTPLGVDTLLLTGFQGEEGISRLFHFRIDMVADVKKEIAFSQILGQKVTIRLNRPLPPNRPRYFSGICVRFSQGEADTDFCTYQMEMAPAFWMWTKVAQTRTFQQQGVPEILKTVLQGLDVTYQLSGTYEPRNYCVQYRETDFNFACRSQWNVRRRESVPIDPWGQLVSERKYTVHVQLHRRIP
jgi:type VI secretion system secreted protein VgrG